jgi:hypothetical protein
MHESVRRVVVKSFGKRGTGLVEGPEDHRSKHASHGEKEKKKISKSRSLKVASGFFVILTCQKVSLKMKDQSL